MTAYDELDFFDKLSLGFNNRDGEQSKLDGYDIIKITQPSYLLTCYAIITVIVLVLIGILWGISEEHEICGPAFFGVLAIVIGSVAVRHIGVNKALTQMGKYTDAQKVEAGLKQEQSRWHHNMFTSSDVMSATGLAGLAALNGQPSAIHWAFVVVFIVLILIIVFASLNEKVRSSGMYVILVLVAAGTIMFYTTVLVLNKTLGNNSSMTHMADWNNKMRMESTATATTNTLLMAK